MKVKPTGGLGSPFGSQVERTKPGFASSHGVSAEEESVAESRSAIFTRTGFGTGFLLRSTSGLAGLLRSDSGACTEAGRWPILPATVKRAASGSCTRAFQPSWALSSTLSRSAMLLFALAVASPSHGAASSASEPDVLPMRFFHSCSPLF